MQLINLVIELQRTSKFW